MTALPLTSDALKGVKRSIQTLYPELKSAHLSEAMAAGLGFRTHAALLPRVDLRPSDDPDYGFFDEDEFGRRAFELSATSVDTDKISFAALKPFGAIVTHSPGAGRVDLTTSLRKKAWRNAMVAAINAGIDQRLFSIRPGDCRWNGWSSHRGNCRGTEYEFNLNGAPAVGWVDDAGFDELVVHVAIWPTAEGRRFISAGNAGLLAGEVFATGWLERRDGAWLQVGNDVGSGWTFSSRRTRLNSIANLAIRPHGYAADGSFKM